MTFTVSSVCSEQYSQKWPSFIWMKWAQRNVGVWELKLVTEALRKSHFAVRKGGLM